MKPAAFFRNSLLLLFALLITESGATGEEADTIERFRIRASELDDRVQSYPEINFVLENKAGQPADVQHASVDPSVAERGRLVIWLMGYHRQLFDRLNSFGLHTIQPHYARAWFGICCQQKPVGPHCRGNLRLEAATGRDFSPEVDLAPPDGMMERAFQMVLWLSSEHPDGHWDQFLNAERTGLLWEKVIVAGASHGSTTAARFAKHQKVARVVAFCGPRDQYQEWQSLPSATPQNRYFGFSHVLDGGWTGDHYCRSWQLLGMHRYGPIQNVDQQQPPYGNTRRLVTDFDVQGDARRAHGAVLPGKSARKGADGEYAHEAVWRYLFTHPVDQVGSPDPAEPECLLNHRQ